MDDLIPLLVVVGLLVVGVVSVVEDRRIARELARRPDREFSVAGLDRDAIVSRHHTWGLVPFRSRRELRQLDRARDSIAAWEAQQERERGDQRGRQGG